MYPASNLLTVYRILLFLVFEAYALIGIWGLSLNMKSRQNRLFFIICYALAVWALSLTMSNSSATYETALFWRRFGALGWGSVYSLILHYFLILTKRIKVLPRKTTLLVLYLPVLVNFLVFFIIGEISRNEFNLLLTEFGWINILSGSLWDTFFNVYYSGFSVLILALLAHWGWRNKESRRHAVYFILSYIIAFIIGSLTDIIWNRIFETALPAMAPLFIIIPVAVFARGVRWYGILSPVINRKTALPNQILSEMEQMRVFTKIGAAFVSISILILSIYFFNSRDIYSVMIISSGIFFMGFTIMVLRNLSLSPKKRDTIMPVIVGISMIFFLNYFIFPYGTNFVWQIPFLFMIVAVVFNRSMLLYTIIGIALIMQLWFGMKYPELRIRITKVDHIVRIGSYILGGSLAIYVKKVYFKRLKEIESQIGFEKLISYISTNLATVSGDNIEDSLREITERLGVFFNSDHVVLVSFQKDPAVQKKIFSWNKRNESGLSNFSNTFDFITEDSWLVENVREKGFLFLSEGDDVQKVDPEFEEKIGAESLSSLVALSLRNNERELGYLCFFYRSPPDNANLGFRRQLSMVIHLISEVLTKIDRENEISYMAFYDHLTGLPNRALFNDRVHKAISLAKRTEKLIAVMMLDLDSFKKVNDTMGHDAGDKLLQKVAVNLSGCVRDYDTISRFGGDEFLFIISQINETADLEQVADKLMSKLSEPISINDKNFHITGSIGISVYPFDGTEPEILIKNADMAMYETKKRGKNNYSFCSLHMKKTIKEQLELTDDMYKAIERKEFFLLYQPQIDTMNQKIKGVEALVRWQHPEKGLINPAIFIPLAEEANLINRIGNWVIEQACEDCVKLQNQTGIPIRIAVNLSIKQFLSPDIIDYVAGILGQTGLEPESLELEITESVAMVDSVEVNHMLLQLKELGVSISIDDFGTEYSSLSRLKNMPIDRLKIDKQFIEDLTNTGSENAIAAFIVDLSKNLGLEVIAEGVETRQQYSYLLEQECNEIQGFYFSKPIPIGDIKKLLKNERIDPAPSN